MQRSGNKSVVAYFDKAEQKGFFFMNASEARNIMPKNQKETIDLNHLRKIMWDSAVRDINNKIRRAAENNQASTSYDITDIYLGKPDDNEVVHAFKIDFHKLSALSTEVLKSLCIFYREQGYKTCRLHFVTFYYDGGHHFTVFSFRCIGISVNWK